MELADQTVSYEVLDCKNCTILWNRGVHASKNKTDISQFIWDGNGRPLCFKRQVRESPYRTRYAFGNNCV